MGWFSSSSNSDSDQIVAALKTSQAVVEISADGIITSASGLFLTALNTSIEQVKGKSWLSLVNETSQNSAKAAWQSVLSGAGQTEVFAFASGDGQLVHLQVNHLPIGQPITKVVAVARDVSEQVANEWKAKEAANFANVLVECQANVMVADNDLNIVFVNKQVQAMLRRRETTIKQVLPNFDVNNLVGTCVDDFHKNPAHQRTMLANLSSVYNTKLNLAGVVFDLTATPWVSADGERLGTLVEWNDITDKLASEKKDADLAKVNGRIKSALDVCQANVMMADDNFDIVYINESVHQMLKGNETKLKTALPNFDADSLVGTNIDVFHKNPQHQRDMLAKMTSVYKTQLDIAGLNFKLTATPVFDEDNNRLGTIVEWEDITAELAQQVADKQAAESNLRIKQALDNVTTSAMVADGDNVIIYINEAAENMMLAAQADLQRDLPNFDARKIVGNSVDIFHKNPAHQQAMLAKLTDTYRTQITVGGRSFDLVANPIIGDDGGRIGTVVEWNDVTEELARLKKEKVLADTNARVKQALDNVATCAMVADENNDIIYMNDAVTKMLQVAEADLRKELPHFNANDVLGKNVDIFHKNPAHQQNLLAKLSSTYKTEIVVGGRTFALTANPIVSDEGNRLGTVVEWLDRTAEVAIEKEVEGLIEAASSGDLSIRVEEEGKQGFFKQLSSGLNQIVAISEGVINDTVEILDALAHGNLTQRITTEYQGSFDKLKRDANTTAEKLTEVIGRIEESANTVATGAEEIAQGNADLSQRTEEQASSLEETASSMEEMTSTVRQNADNARSANQLAQEAEQKASSGGDIVSKAVSSMAEINESSKKISDIIGVIDEIAFQTNLLALNAAVEAARAGEQGRGFAVVAGEVRNLAQRSAAAAKEIKDLIRDSVTKVEDGTSLVNQSGDMLNEIVEAVRKVNSTIADISVASEEQSSGIEQVNKAVSQMDEMTQQNAALVEEASAAGESMSEQARSMKQLLSFFQLSDMQVSSAPAIAPPPRSLPNKSAPAKSPSPSKQLPDDEEWEEF